LFLEGMLEVAIRSGALGAPPHADEVAIAVALGHYIHRIVGQIL
jgi:hypothetical protein